MLPDWRLGERVNFFEENVDRELYQAPETIQAEECCVALTPASEVWSFGVTLFVLATG